jgi:uncharacterized membrane protein YdjX (TVP38/TMEM64 family)
MACIASLRPGVANLNLITFASHQIKSRGKQLGRKERVYYRTSNTHLRIIRAAADSALEVPSFIAGTSRVHRHRSAPAATTKLLHRCLRVASLLPDHANYESSSQNIPPTSEMSKLPAFSNTSAPSPSPSSSSTAVDTISTFLAPLSSAVPATLLLFILSAVILPLPAEAFSLQDAVSGLEAAITAAGPLGPILFIGAYVVATVFLIPASVLTVAAGFLFGPILGSVVVSIAATLGATAAFLVGRYLARPAVAQRAAEDSRFAAVDKAIAAQGAKIVLLLRLSPLLPFSLLNYALSLTSIPLGSYIGASWAGMLPGTIAYVALGGAGKAAAETAAGVGTSPLQLVLYGVGALATLGATVLISRAASQALKEASAEEEEESEPLQGGGGRRR